MTLKTDGLHHLALRVTDRARAKQFYTEALGFPIVMESHEVLIVNANGVFIGIRAGAPETEHGDRFNPYRVGLDHLALAVPNAVALEDVKRQLDAAGVSNNGIEDDAVLGGRYISFCDPDGIAWELYASAGQ